MRSLKFRCWRFVSSFVAFSFSKWQSFCSKVLPIIIHTMMHNSGSKSSTIVFFESILMIEEFNLWKENKFTSGSQKFDSPKWPTVFVDEVRAKTTQFRVIVDHCILLSKYLCNHNAFYNKCYKRFSTTNSTNPRQQQNIHNGFFVWPVAGATAAFMGVELMLS